MNSFWVGVLVGSLIVPSLCLLVVCIGVWVTLVRRE